MCFKLLLQYESTQKSPSPHMEPEEPIVEEQSARTTAPRDINFNLDERSILPGNSKRQRTKSNRAAGTASYYKSAYTLKLAQF